MTKTHYRSQQQLVDTVDLLLTDIAIRLQLSQTAYNKAVDRYETINKWIERDGSPLKDRVELFYPQGSMAIGATIASKLKTDEFDIDIAAQLDLSSVAVSPKIVLDLLFEAIRGNPESRYYHVTERRTRCITVKYADHMHIDVTPMIRMDGTPERQSFIFHHKEEAQQEPSYKLIANPYGFSEWFKQSIPEDHVFSDTFEKRSWEYEETLQALAEKAENEPVPPQEPPLRKSIKVVVLQLLKRWRNVQYDTRSGRNPPSIMFTKLVADSANHAGKLSEALLQTAQHMLNVFQYHQNQGCCIEILNPVCHDDVLTDRWPESLQDQDIFINDLENLIRQIDRLIKGCDLEEMQKIMIQLFGEAPTAEAVRAFNEQVGRMVRDGRSQHRTGKGGLILPGGAALTTDTTSTVRPTPKHTFYGGDCED